MTTPKKKRVKEKKYADMTPPEQIVMLMDHHARGEALAPNTARDAIWRITDASPDGEPLIKWLKHEFTNTDMEPANLLPGFGIRYGWQYATLTYGEFERLVPDRKTRGGIKSVLSPTGLLLDTQFSEEHLRYFQNRPQNLFDDPAKIALAKMRIGEFIQRHGSGKLKYEHTTLGKYLPELAIVTLLDFLTDNGDELQQKLSKLSGLYYSHRYLDLLDELVVTHGFWTDLKLTEAEQKTVQGWNEQLL